MQDHQLWAKEMQQLLLDLRKAVEEAERRLPTDEAEQCRRRYRKLLEKAEVECPPPDETQRKEMRGRLKRSKARNLLERLCDFLDNINGELGF